MRKVTKKVRSYGVAAVRGGQTGWMTPISRERALALLRRHGTGMRRDGHFQTRGQRDILLDCCPQEHAFAKGRGADEFYVYVA